MRRDVVLIPLYLWVSASICLHIVSYFGTNEVAARAARDLARRAAANARASASAQDNSTEIELIYQPPAPPPSTAAQPLPDETPQAAVIDPNTTRSVPDPVHPRRVPPPPQQRRLAARTPPRPTPPPTRPTPPTPTPPPTPAVAVPVRPRTIPRMQHVDQENQNNEPAPEDPAFLAQSNNNVREQTIAALRNLNRDQAHPQVGGAPTHNSADQQGNGAQDRSADDRDVNGDRRRVPETSPHPPTRAPSTQAVANAAPGAGGATQQGGAARAAGRAGRAGAEGQPGQAGAAVVARAPGMAENVLTAPGGHGALAMGAAGSTASAQNSASGTGGDNGRNGRNGANGEAAAIRMGINGLGAAGALAALTPTHTTYAQVYGAQAEAERRVAQERRSQARGSYTESWRENRASIENYTPGVRVGNQTALRTAQSPFSAYLTAMHRRIHRLFADGFIPDLERLGPTSPLNDMSLVTTVEVILERDGRIHRLGVVRTSGNLQFDVASLNSVRRAAPFGEAPAAILSGDGRVYLHWGFYRNDRQCGTFNVDPYILPNPGQGPLPTPRAPTPQRGPVPSDEHAPMPPARLGQREPRVPRG